MKNTIFTVLLLALSVIFAGCDKAKAEDAKNKGASHAKHPAPQSILIIDDVAYIDGCKGCECVEEDVCVCEAKADCECCRRHLKKVPHEMQEKCKQLKRAHTKTTADCNDCKKDDKDTACKDSGGGHSEKSNSDSAKKGK